MVPLLTGLLRLEPRVAAGTSLAALFFNSLASVWGYHGQKRIDYRSGLLFVATSVPTSIAGAYAASHISAPAFDISFGALMFVVSLSLVFRPTHPLRVPLPANVKREFTDSQGAQHVYTYNGLFAVCISAVMGFLSSLLGIGGGSVLVPSMVLLLSFPPHIAGATSMFTILVSSAVGGTTHALLGDVRWLDLAFLAPGAFIGGRIGSRLAKRISGVWLIRVLSFCLMTVALQVLWRGLA